LEEKSAEEGLVLTEAQVQALERKKQDDLACGEVETAHPGYLGSQDTFYVGTIKGVGRVYQQTYVDTYSKVAAAKLYTTKTPITAADLLNDKVLPFMAGLGMGVIRILTDRGTEYCGKVETHDYQLYLAVNDIEHTKTKVHHPQTNGICERFHKTILGEFYRVTFRKKMYQSLQQLQDDLDGWIDFFLPEGFSVEQSLHRSVSATHFALVSTLIIVEIDPLVKILLKFLKALVYLLPECHPIELIQYCFMKAFADSIGLWVSNFGFGMFDHCCPAKR